MMLSRERRFVAILCAGLAAALAIYALFFRPLENRARQLRTECLSKESFLADVRRGVQSGRNLPTRDAWVSEARSSVALNELTKLGKSKGLTFASITPDMPVSSADGGLIVLPVHLETEGGYQELGVFLGSLESLEASVTTVSRFRVTLDPARPSGIKGALLLDVHLLRNEA